MRRGVGWLRRGAFGLAIAAALAFGGFQAFAGPTAMGDPCDWNPPDFGPCTSQQQCQTRCDNYYEEQHLGFCEWSEQANDWCCICVAL